MEAVTTRGYILAVAIMLGASALPLAAAERIGFSRELPPTNAGATFDRVHVRVPYLEEHCVGPYRLFCVGPFEQEDIIVPVGKTGGSASVHDAGALSFVDTERSQAYGPYIIDNPFAPDIGDDVNICYWQCLAPNPFYARAHGNLTVTVYVAGSQIARNVTLFAEVGAEGSFPFPPAFGCPGYHYPCE